MQEARSDNTAAEAVTDEPALRTTGSVFRNFSRALRLRIKRMMPTGLFARSLVIVITPMVLLQSVVAFVFMERHWELVTQRLSAAVSQDVAALVALYESDPTPSNEVLLANIAEKKLNLSVSFLAGGDLPAAAPKPFFSLLDQALSVEVNRYVQRPYWIDTLGRSNLIEIRIRLDNVVMRVIAHRSQTYASNSHIFLVWMIGTSFVLIGVAVAFLRNQIRPIQQLAEAADRFGKGREVMGFQLRGAREVRQAASAFLVMRARIERQIEQRTAMLAGVSHDLRTVLTRFKLQLAVFGDEDELSELNADVDEMQNMLEDYLAFARGDQGEQSATEDLAPILMKIAENARAGGVDISLTCRGDLTLNLRMGAFKRCISNLVNNATKFSQRVRLHAERDSHWLKVRIDDDGPGIPDEEREAVFRPFYRLDSARNQDRGNSGLGLAIARDIARSHGGEITLTTSPLGGLRAMVQIPV